ncbi:MAG: succinate dehydrogenase, hydrophobic membrane anchor protein [Proteobacteria bacterium]|nr:succinate dehydrogenase, hydrophobic membrane anchor protein [Pseudomonadota bacterium]
MELRSTLGRVRGLGSAKDGAHHWWAQRTTAVALVPLSLWFVASVIALVGANHATAVAWFRSPINATLMVLLIVATFYHAALGLQVVLEDYVHHEGQKVAGILAVKGLAALLGLLAAIAVLKLAFGG